MKNRGRRDVINHTGNEGAAEAKEQNS